jgi:hypothetical protein
MSEMPQDPFGPPEEMVMMMKVMYNLYSSTLASGFPEHVAIQFVTGVFVTLMQGSQIAQQAPAATEE